MSKKLKISVCIPTAKYPNTIYQAIDSLGRLKDDELLINHDSSGCGNNLNALMKKATGDILLFLCDDDLLVDPIVLERIRKKFEFYPNLGVLGRYYYWFIDSPLRPVRIKKSEDILELSDQISGMAFRKEFMRGQFKNEPFIEVASMVEQTSGEKDILEEYTIAVRISGNGSMNKNAYKKSPIMQWYNLVGKKPWVVNNFVGLVQIKNYAGQVLLLREIWYLIWLEPLNLLKLRFWFFALGTLLTPAFILRPLTHWYKRKMHSRWIKF